MAIAGRDLERATRATEVLLEELGLEAYVYEVEPRDGPWEVVVECPITGGGWQTVTIEASLEQLLSSLDEAEVRQSLVRQWAQRFTACARTE